MHTGRPHTLSTHSVTSHREKLPPNRLVTPPTHSRLKCSGTWQVHEGQGVGHSTHLQHHLHACMDESDRGTHVHWACLQAITSCRASALDRVRCGCLRAERGNGCMIMRAECGKGAEGARPLWELYQVLAEQELVWLCIRVLCSEVVLQKGAGLHA